MTQSPQVAIIGAGPYGMSMAAHLRARGIEFRIFGRPMHSWRARMPAGMFLKSEGFASSLSDPDRRFTLKRFCVENGHAYADTDFPVPLETFTAYGLAFQQQLVPDVEDRKWSHSTGRPIAVSSGGSMMTGRSRRAASLSRSGWPNFPTCPLASRIYHPRTSP